MLNNLVIYRALVLIGTRKQCYKYESTTSYRFSSSSNRKEVELDSVRNIKLRKMKFCANLSFMFTEGKTIVERYALAKDAGFKAVESGFPLGHTLEEVRAAKEGAGVEQVLINLKTGDLSKGELGVTAVPDKEATFRENLKETIEYAKAVGARKLHIMAGRLENATAKNWEIFESNLRYAAGELKKDNIIGVIEPINHYSVPKYFLSDFNKALDLIKRIDSPFIRLQLDIFHLQHIAGDLSNNIKRLMPYVGHVQIAQVPNRNEPDTAGEVNYQYILQLIQEAGYDDWVGLEYKPLGNTKAGLKWIQNYGYSL